MTAIEESAGAFRIGECAFRLHPNWPIEQWLSFPWRRLFVATDNDFRDGWRSAQREAEIERHIDEAANVPAD